MIPGWNYNELDRGITEELQQFLPDRIFDAHAHIYRVADLSAKSEFEAEGPGEITVDVWST